MSRGAWMLIRTFSPMIESTETSMSSPIMIDWLDFRVSTSIAPSPCRGRASAEPYRARCLCIESCEISAYSSKWEWGLRPTGAPSALGCAPSMSRRSLRPQLNQIRSWVRQGRTDAWIAHQLEVTVQQIQAFKRENELDADGNGGDTYEEVDL